MVLFDDAAINSAHVNSHTFSISILSLKVLEQPGSRSPRGNMTGKKLLLELCLNFSKAIVIFESAQHCVLKLTNHPLSILARAPARQRAFEKNAPVGLELINLRGAALARKAVILRH